MKISKKQELNTKVIKKIKEVSLGKVSKEKVKTEVRSIKTDSKKSLVTSKVNNAKQITIHLFSSTMKTSSISSKSTPMMSFKNGSDERKISAIENKLQNQTEEVLLPERNYNASILKNEKTDKLEKLDKGVVTQSSTNKIKVSKKQNMFRKSITSKEDIYNYNSNNNYNNKNSFTPDSKKSVVGGKKKAVMETKSKSGSNFPFIEAVNSPTNKNNMLSSNYVLSTNYTESNNNPTTSPGISPTNKNTQGETHHNVNKNQSKNLPHHKHHDIVSTIQSLGTILKSHTSNIDEIKKNPKEMIKLNELNNRLKLINNHSPNVNSTENKQHVNFEDSYLKFHLNDSRNLMMENNVIRRETFIDNNFNKKMQVSEKEVILNEIYNNSNNRIKKYGILFEFINSNIKEITEMMSQNNTMNKHLEEDNNANIIFNKDIQKVLNEEKLLKDISYSFINSSGSDIDFYRNLIDQTFNQKVDSLSNEMSTMQMASKIDLTCNTNEKLDKTQNQYDDETLRSKQVTPTGEENETRIINERNAVELDRRIKINPHNLLRNLKEKQLERQRNKEMGSNNSTNKSILANVEPDKESKCIIF